MKRITRNLAKFFFSFNNIIGCYSPVIYDFLEGCSEKVPQKGSVFVRNFLLKSLILPSQLFVNYDDDDDDLNQYTRSSKTLLRQTKRNKHTFAFITPPRQKNLM